MKGGYENEEYPHNTDESSEPPEYPPEEDTFESGDSVDGDTPAPAEEYPSELSDAPSVEDEPTADEPVADEPVADEPLPLWKRMLTLDFWNPMKGGGSRRRRTKRSRTRRASKRR